MITDRDIARIKAALKEDFTIKDDLTQMESRMDSKFATKDDLTQMESRMDSKFATKDDLNSMEARMDRKFATKEDLRHMGDKIEASVGVAASQLIAYTNEVTEDLREDMNQGFADVRTDIAQMRADHHDFISFKTKKTN